jgi:Pyridine nucleotide-disulphide oxidoreductase
MKLQTFDTVIIGGGPAAAAEGIRLTQSMQRVALISENYGGCLGMLAHQRLQSYIPELEIANAARSLGSYIGSVERMTPTGAEFTRYIIDVICALPIHRIPAIVIGIRRLGPDLLVDYQTSSNCCGALRAAEVILATGLTARNPGPWAVPGKTVSCFEAYREISSQRLSRYAGRNVVIVGSGNSAFQLAISLARIARSVTVLANSYLGLYPQETDDRFALRAPSQNALEWIAKAGTADNLGPLNSGTTEYFAPAWLHVYSQLSWDPAECALTVHIRQRDNTARIPAISFARGFAANRLRKHNGCDEYCLTISGDDLVVISAIGVKARIPQTAWDDLVDPISGFVSHEHGRTHVNGLYVAGACAGYRSVNTMQSPATTCGQPIRRARGFA